MSEIPDPIEPLVTRLLKEIGEDPGRSGLERTPGRVARSLRYFTTGYQQDPKDLLNGALFEVSYDEMVIVKDIEFYSLCEHHLLPFFGRVHVAYIPNGKVLGLSNIAETLEALLEPKGVAVVAEAIHLCMMMRGVRQQNASAITSSIRGEFENDPKTRAEFMDLLRQRRESFA
jgi:GTP cyclohydrolase I